MGSWERFSATPLHELEQKRSFFGGFTIEKENGGFFFFFFFVRGGGREGKGIDEKKWINWSIGGT